MRVVGEHQGTQNMEASEELTLDSCHAFLYTKVSVGGLDNLADKIHLEHSFYTEEFLIVHLNGQRHVRRVVEIFNLRPATYSGFTPDSYFTSQSEEIPLDEEQRVLEIYDRFETRNFQAGIPG